MTHFSFGTKQYINLIVILFLLIVSCTEEGPSSPEIVGPDPIELKFNETDEFELKVATYTSVNISGFHVLVEKKAIESSITKTNKALALLETSLNKVNNLPFNDTIKNQLLAVPIFIDLATETDKAAVYHASRDWLSANGYIVEKERAVEITNITNFMNWSEQNQPYMVLHELTHAFHHRVYDFQNSDITNAFNNLMDKGLYQNVRRHNGNGNYTVEAEAYARVNEIEFFAEVSEAYFGENDYFPFDKEDLAAYDSVAFKMVEKVWEQE